MFGRLGFDALPHDLITIGGAVTMLVAGVGIIIALTYLKRWKWLYKEWLTTLDPKKIGVMYLIVSAVMLVRALRRMVA